MKLAKLTAKVGARASLHLLASGLLCLLNQSHEAVYARGRCRLLQSDYIWKWQSETCSSEKAVLDIKLSCNVHVADIARTVYSTDQIFSRRSNRPPAAMKPSIM